MLRIDCPFCGVRDHSEFSYGSSIVDYPALDADITQWESSVYSRDNQRGLQVESWQHVHGCRLWLRVERDTFTHEILAVRALHSGINNLLNEQVDSDDYGIAE